MSPEHPKSPFLRSDPTVSLLRIHVIIKLLYKIMVCSMESSKGSNSRNDGGHLILVERVQRNFKSVFLSCREQLSGLPHCADKHMNK